jgi:hypothetical protein
MKEPVVFDFSEPRHRERTTSASSHPELISGDFATPPRRFVTATALQRSVAYDQRRAMGGSLAIAAIAILLSGVALKSGATADNDAEQQKLVRTCLQWHLAASALVSRQVQSVRDIDLLQVSNSIDRMRRARRNCELGEFAEACEDYHTVASSMPGQAMTNILFSCTNVVATSFRD